MAASYYTKTITFSTNANKTGEVIIANGKGAQYPLYIKSTTNCTIKSSNNIVISPPYTEESYCTVYPYSNNWEVVCYNQNANNHNGGSN